MSCWVIGDIQGCFDEFRDLLREVDYREGRDELWLVGDLVNRGPDNAGTLDYLMSLDPSRVEVVLGNHDIHFLAVARGVRAQRCGDTLDDLLGSPCLDDMVDWLRFQSLLHVDRRRRHILVHAGLPPVWTLPIAEACAREVEGVLRSAEHVEYLASVFENQPDTWREDLAGMERLRVITNYLTRLRFCTPAGKMDLDAKLTTAPKGFAPWFELPCDREGMKITFGHWAAIEGETGVNHAVALDTGCVWGGRLTAYRLDDGARVTVPGRQLPSDKQ